MASVSLVNAEALTAKVGQIYNGESAADVLASVAMVVKTIASIHNLAPAQVMQDLEIMVNHLETLEVRDDGSKPGDKCVEKNTQRAGRAGRAYRRATGAGGNLHLFPILSQHKNRGNKAPIRRRSGVSGENAGSDEG
jgi:hypothetical protein